MNTLTQDYFRELRELPRRARVAFAARCARRVQALHMLSKPTVSQQHREVVERAVNLAEVIAAGGGQGNDATSVYYIVTNAAVTAKTAVEDYIGDAAAYAAYAARAIIKDDEQIGIDFDVTNNAADAATVSTKVTNNLKTRQALLDAMRHDLELLISAAAQNKWTNKTPVPPEFFGLLWHDGPPENWPVEDIAPLSRPVALQVQIAVPSGLSVAESDAFNGTIAKFYAALSRYHAAVGGTGLRIADGESAEPIDAARETPVETGCAPVGVGQ